MRGPRFLVAAAIVVAAAFTVAHQPHGQMLDPIVADTYHSSGYTGPGDVVSGGYLYVSCGRAYNASYASSGGALCDWACTNGSAFTGTIHAASTGGPKSSDLSTITSDCGSQTVYVTKGYDQTGNSRHLTGCSGTACLTLSITGLNSLPIMSAAGEQSIYVGGLTQAQPVTLSLVYETCASGISAANCNGGFGSQIGDTPTILQGGSSNTDLYYYAGSFAGPVTLANSSWYSIQAVFNNGSSGNSLNYNGSSNTTAPGTGAWTGSGSNQYVCLGSLSGGSCVGSNPVTASFAEAGIWTTSFTSTQITNLTSNQRAYWNF